MLLTRVKGWSTPNKVADIVQWLAQARVLTTRIQKGFLCRDIVGICGGTDYITWNHQPGSSHWGLWMISRGGPAGGWGLRCRLVGEIRALRGWNVKLLQSTRTFTMILNYLQECSNVKWASHVTFSNSHSPQWHLPLYKGNFIDTTQNICFITTDRFAKRFESFFHRHCTKYWYYFKILIISIICSCSIL